MMFGIVFRLSSTISQESFPFGSDGAATVNQDNVIDSNKTVSSPSHSENDMEIATATTVMRSDNAMVMAGQVSSNDKDSAAAVMTIVGASLQSIATSTILADNDSGQVSLNDNDSAAAVVTTVGTSIQSTATATISAIDNEYQIALAHLNQQNLESSNAAVAIVDTINLSECKTFDDVHQIGCLLSDPLNL